MFKYSDNEELRKEFKKIAIDQNMSMAAIAEKCDMIPQQLNNRFNNKKISFEDFAKWCDAMNCDLVVDIVKRDCLE